MARIGRVAVIGGGVAGLVSALALRGEGAEVTVHERYAHLQGRATGFTVWSYAISKLVEAGVDSDILAAIGSPIEATEVLNQRGDVIYSLPFGEAGKELGAPSYDIDRADLQRILIEALGNDVVRMGSEVTGVAQPEDGGRAQVSLAGGSTVDADLVLGADGIHALSRDLVAPGSVLRYSDYVALSAVTDLPAGVVAPQHHIEVWGKGAKAGLGDVGRGKARWYVTAKLPSGGEKWGRERILEHLEGWPEPIRTAVSSTDDDAIVLAEGWFLEPLPRWVDRRLVLLGDAAHATTAFGSSGACSAIEDAVDLTARLRSEATIDDALRAYVQDRKQRADKLQRRSDRMQHLAQLHNPSAWARDVLFRHAPPEQVGKIAHDIAAGTD